MDRLKRIKGIIIVKYMAGGTAALLPPVLFFYLLECYTHNPFQEVRPQAQFFNILLFELAAAFLFFVTGRLKTAWRAEGAAAMLFGIANSYVVRFRTNPIVPWDLFSWRTAANVAGNYDFTPDGRQVAVTLIFLAVLAALQPVRVRCAVSLPEALRGRQGVHAGLQILLKRILPAVLVAAVTAVFARTLQQEEFQNRHLLYNKLFTPVFMTNADGIAVTFVMNMAYMSIEKPQGYDRAEAEELLSARGGENDSAGSELPNIIVVMNESFSDLSVIGDFEVTRDCTPFLHSLQQGARNTVTGMLNVSVCGGNTANTEFEFLTGNTMAFLPQGSIPYQQYLTGETPSLASHLRNLGYQTIATHPYMASGWERDTVYPWLGFDRSIFIEGYRGMGVVRQYVSDGACVEKIIRLYEQKEAGKPLFLFQVTMQNHGGYEDLYENFAPEITAAGGKNVSLNQYLSLTELSDQSLKSLISYFSGVEEKTVVVFFGDHQPGDMVAYSVLALHGMRWNALDEEEIKLRYQVPYVIWANYDIGQEQGADTSVNYLAADVLSRAGVPTDAYHDFLLGLKKEYPVISTVRTVKADGSEVPSSGEAGEMDVYRKLQYYRLFDGGEK